LRSSWRMKNVGDNVPLVPFRGCGGYAHVAALRGFKRDGELREAADEVEKAR
jgi:hypothetical protein